MQWIIICIILSLFIIPLPFSVKNYISFADKKLYVNILIFRFIKVKSCYLNYRDGKFFFHLSDKKAIEFKATDIVPKKNNMGMLNIFKFNKFKYYVVLNGENDMVKYLILSFLNNINAITFAVLKEYYPKFKFQGNVYVCCETKVCGVLSDVGGTFSIFTAIKGLLTAATD